MYIINQAYEKAKFADIERHVEHEHQVLEYLEDEIFSGNTKGQPSSHRKFLLAMIGLLSMFTNPIYR